MDLAPDTPLDILVVEDDADIAEAVVAALRQHGHRATAVGDGDRALGWLEDHAVDLLICDVRLPGVDGLTILRRMKDLRPEMPVILMSAYGSISEAVGALKLDAAHYLAKPFDMQELLDAVNEAGLQVAASHRVAAVRAGHNQEADAAIIGASPAIVAMRELLRSVAAAQGPVLVTGETGTGKELVAQTIHRLSERREERFVALNCAAFPDTLIESELFGHERGAFTGASHRRDGLLRAADGGTLFLDEVGEISPSAQAKLLRAVETGTFQAVGSDSTSKVDVRLVSATNADLRAEDGQFRSDLFYRLKMFHVRVPPLRERRIDLPLLVEHFLTTFAEPDPPTMTPRCWAALMHYDYPGNVRELRSAIGHAVALASDGEIDVKHLPAEFRGGGEPIPRDGDGELPSLEEAGKQFERDYLLRTLDTTGWNKTRAAEMLGISRKTLWKKLRDLRIEST